MFTALLFRRHQCPDLGWEWHKSFGSSERESVKDRADESIDQTIYRYPVPITRSRFKVKVVQGTLDESEPARLTFLRKINEPFMAERAKWPTLVESLEEEEKE